MEQELEEEEERVRAAFGASPFKKMGKGEWTHTKVVPTEVNSKKRARILAIGPGDGGSSCLKKTFRKKFGGEATRYSP